MPGGFGLVACVCSRVLLTAVQGGVGDRNVQDGAVERSVKVGVGDRNVQKGAVEWSVQVVL